MPVLCHGMAILPCMHCCNHRCIWAEGEAKRDLQDWYGVVTAFTNAGAYSNAVTQNTETRYRQAVSLYTSNDYTGAAAIFFNIKGYKDVDSLLANDNNLSSSARSGIYSRQLCEIWHV